MSKAKSILKSGVLLSIFISVESNYVRNRDNILNKGTWVKSENDKLFDKSGYGDFLFKPNSINVDDLLQDDFYSFRGNHVQDTPFIPNYIERTKRSPNVLEKRFRKSIKPTDINKSIMKSTATPKLASPSVLSVYPYDIAVLLGKVKNNNKIMLEEVVDKSTHSSNLYHTESSKQVHETSNPNKTFEVIMANEILVDDSDNHSNITQPKRSMNKDYESEVIKKIEIVEGLNESRNDRNIFDNKIRTWHQNVPAPDVNIYKVIPKSEEHATISEKGLLKLLSILTRTFKKIMKQHVEIKKIHSEMFASKEDIDKSVSLLINKFNDFESKYTDLKNYNEKIQEIQKKLEAKEEYFKNKEIEMSRNLADFENQQKKFLTQQRQFYNIQKLMLAQNEKINAKQNQIAKTQSEISRRQNNFARILKKVKQVYVDRKGTNPKSQSKIANSSESDAKAAPTTTSTTAKPVFSESVKIDLFSIPSIDSARLANQDKLILKEKDEHPVDDLVYKYYFNNTFIDNLMRNQILSGTLHGNKFMTRNAKSKRNEGKKIKTTVLIPVYNNNLDIKVPSSNGNKNKRAKRWIRHHSKGKGRRRHHKMTTDYEMKDEKNSHPIINSNLVANTEINTPTPTTIDNKIVPDKTVQANIKPLISLEILGKSVPNLNPFTTMATNFCNQIGQNGNPIMLSWCIEKVMRRLQNMETIPLAATLQKTVSTPASKTSSNYPAKMPQTNPTTVIPSVTTMPPMPSQMGPQSTTEPPKSTVSAVTTPPPSILAYFPDNDELESNLKQYEIKADDEGTVFYDGSLHASEILGNRESEGFSDFMPGIDSNSRIALDPLTFDLRAMRRASFRRINDNTLKRQRGIV